MPTKSALIHRHIGGLETDYATAAQMGFIHRHIGGLEIGVRLGAFG